MKRSSNALKSTQPPSTYEIFSTMGGVVKRKKYVAPVALHPLRLVNKSADLFRLLVATYLKNFSQDTGRSSLPLVVFCSKDSFAGTAFSFLKAIARNKFGPKAAARIKLICDANQREAWNSSFIASPNKRAPDVDVLFISNVIYSGFSLDCHFRGSFEFLFKDAMTYREELQLTSQLRYMNRTDMAPFRYGWIEPGNPEKRVAASIDRQFGADMSLEDVMLMRDIFAFVNQERNDTYNRHRELHIQEHEQSNVPFMIQDFEVDIEIPQEWKDFCSFQNIKSLLWEIVDMSDANERSVFTMYFCDDANDES